MGNHIDLSSPKKELLEQQHKQKHEKKAGFFLLVFIVLVILIFTTFPHIQRFAMNRYEKFNDSYENIVIYETDTDTYVVFPYMDSINHGQIHPLPNGNYLIVFREFDENNKHKPVALLYTSSWEYLEEVDFVPTFITTFSSEIRLSWADSTGLNPSFFMLEYEYDSEAYTSSRTISIPYQYNSEYNTIEPITLYKPDNSTNANANTNTNNSGVIYVDGTILYEDTEQSFIVLQREDQVLWSYTAEHEAASNFICDFVTDGEWIYVVLNHGEWKEITVIDIDGNVIPVKIVFPEDNRMTDFYGLEYRDNQLILPYSNEDAYGLAFDIDKENFALTCSGSYKESDEQQKHQASYKYEQIYLYRTEFFDKYLWRYCPLWKSKASDRCAQIEVFRMSK